MLWRLTNRRIIIIIIITGPKMAQVAQLSHRSGEMLCVIKYFANSLEVTQVIRNETIE